MFGKIVILTREKKIIKNTPMYLQHSSLSIESKKMIEITKPNVEKTKIKKKVVTIIIV